MVQGISELNRKLTRTIPAKVEEASRAAMEKSAQELVDMMKRLVPVSVDGSHGNLPGTLRDSIGWTWGDAPDGSVVVAQSEADSRGLKITVYAGNTKAFYAWFIEAGTRLAAAHPFFFPSYRALRRRIKSRITRAMKKAIQAESASE
ncbi:HK97-gp10 family putative phage morphogenesis protein [Mesorhizobium sp. RMAD-H1]|uniref:HK97-gp10 family putative phage morphogenesis protein n=1 Tax=Mesorhizobium sp. RMAD-H1 TaxID=2587065 RepID=UPI00161A7E05|nr:HK97-gp10 family putative phage morphogenesis protein [Mesorhizobium sp. RMAD-H1]MBB2973950.1 HK97 gp10 family phage protein [Mesorhizobium sp. RMAD-H1]